MAIFSTGLCNKQLGRNGTDTGADGLRGILDYGIIDLYSGTALTNADSAATGTHLGRITKNGGAFTQGVTTNGLRLDTASGRMIYKTSDAWKFTALATGTIGYAIYRANGVDAGTSSTTLPRAILSVGVGTGELRFNTSLDVTEDTEYTVSSFRLKCLTNTDWSTGLMNRMLGMNGESDDGDGLRGVMQNFVVKGYSGVMPATADAAESGTLLFTATKDGGAFTPGVATNGLNFAAPSGKTISKNGDSWSFEGLADGVVGYCRIINNAADDGSSSATLERIQGSVGVTSGTFLIDSLTITTGAPGQITGCNLGFS